MSDRPFPVALLAGGLATRLHPITERIPKSLVEIAGEPFVFHQLRLLQSKGIERVTICAGHLGEMIETAVGDGTRFDLRVTYSFDGPLLLGTGGALKKAMPFLSDTFFVLYGDSYLPCDYDAVQHAFAEQNRLALMTVFRNDGQWDRSNVEYVDGRIRVYDKVLHSPGLRHIDYGLGVLRARALDLVPAGLRYDLATLYGALLKEGELAAFEVHERFYEIGSPAGLADLRQCNMMRVEGSRD